MPRWLLLASCILAIGVPAAFAEDPADQEYAELEVVVVAACQVVDECGIIP